MSDTRTQPCQCLLPERALYVIVIKLATVTASDMVMQHVLIILTLTVIQGHSDLNRENKQCSILSETVQAIPIKFAVKVARLYV